MLTLSVVFDLILLIVATRAQCEEPAPQPESACPENWHLFEQFCYLVDTSSYKTWAQAQASCIAEGGQLASIHSQQEHNFVHELALSVLVTLGTHTCPGPNSAIWLGLIDENHNRNFRWTDGTTLNYTNWGPGEPDNSCNGDQFCVAMVEATNWNPETPGSWDDIGCNDPTRGFLCKIPALQVTPTPASPSPPCYRTCNDYYKEGLPSGVYTITIGNLTLPVYCIMAEEDSESYYQSGGYTVIQSRMDPTVDFNRTLAEYESGFGYPTPAIGSYWLGLQNIYQLTNRFPMRLNIRTIYCHGEFEAYGDYDHFQISDSSRLYAASSGTFTANGFSCDGFKRPQNGGIDEVGDSLPVRIVFQGCPFATIETYNPAYPGCTGRSIATCAPFINSGGWWFGSCANNLNGRYYPDDDFSPDPDTCDLPAGGPQNGIRWCTSGRFVHKSTVMSLVPNSQKI